MPYLDRISPEIRFLLYCSRTKIDGDSITEIEKILKNKLDWEKIVRILKFHRIASLAYRNIRQTEFLRKSIPEFVYSELRDYYYSAARRNTILWNEFCKILETFETHGIELIPLKGIILGDLLYHNPALRPIYADIDILVKEEKISIATTLLKIIGYNTEEGKKKYAYHLHFTKNNLLLELHWLLIVNWQNKIKTEDLWKRSSKCNINGKDVRVLSNEVLLLSLLPQIRYELSHFCLFRICDINELICSLKDSINWNSVLKISQEYGMMNTLCFTLGLCNKLLSTPIPSHVLVKLTTKSMKRKILKLINTKSIIRNLIENTENRKKISWLLLVRMLMVDSLRENLNIFMYKLKEKIHPEP